ncbi:putative Aminotransferase class V [Trypanosoma vivax]|uniref:Kynureninase n=1 Tax=Trypanosoma vivax (strain Y486) TaxID=1055687 RepID=G0U1S5_TRYVY|nr:putative Aminotransferase class V [Trypanosoma vivax]CCC50224.1 putative kynureninase [Trypanosoma vivax Y486]
MRNNATEKLLNTARAENLALTEDGFADYMDNSDPLRDHRDAFSFPKRRNGQAYVYMSGQTLGLQHKDVETSVVNSLKKWREHGALGAFHHPNPWSELDSLGKREIALIVGAHESEVITMNSHTVNLHLLLLAFYRPKGNRRRVLLGSRAIPSNTYAVVSQLEARGLNPAEDLLFVGSSDPQVGKNGHAYIPTEQFLSAIEKHGDEIAMILLNVLHFVTGQLLDVETIIKSAHAKGIVVGLDCAHAIGNVPLKLHDWEADFAYWCTHRYLNSGPGNVGGAFVHSKHTQAGGEIKTLRAWRGYEKQNFYDTSHRMEPDEGAAGFQICDASVLGMAALLPSVRLMAEVGMDALREKSLLLTSYLELLLSELVPRGAIELLTSVDPSQRGAQLTVRILPNKISAQLASRDSFEDPGDSDAECIERNMRELGVFVSTLAPDLVFLAPVPLYNSFKDVLFVVRALAECF